MIIRNTVSLFSSRKKLSNMVCIAMLIGAGGCSSVPPSSESITGVGPVGYKSDGEKVRTRGLEVPPDLTQLQQDNRYTVPGQQGLASASQYMQQQQPQQQPVAPLTTVAPAGQAQEAVQGMRIVREGSQRWLVADRSPEVLWPEIRRFWLEAGFTLETDMPQTGIMETDWAENRAKIANDIIRRTIGRVFDSLYSTGERDKFRTRIERGVDGGSEIFISHRGAEEVLVGSDKDRTRWTNRPADPELEAEFLARLMVFLGADKEEAKQAAVASNMPPQERARVVKSVDGNFVEMNESFDRAWRRVGLALDQTGFTVEDRNRADGVYYVRYVDQEAEAEGSSKGFLSRWFSSTPEKKAMQYRIAVQGNEARSQVGVLGADGKLERSATGDRILNLLHEQLK